MTISTQQSIQNLLGNGVTSVFTLTMILDSASDINVIYVDATGAQTTLTPSQYTVAINPPATGQIWGVGGTLTYLLSGSPIATGTSLIVQRILPLTQTTTISNQGDFYPQVVETALDTLELQIQQVSSRTGQLRGTWATGVTYNYGDIVIDGANGLNTGNYYLCATANTSGTWTTDLAAGDWSLAITANTGSAALPLAATQGGTGKSSYAQGDILYADSTTTLAKLSKNASATRYLSNTGTTNNPAWAQVDLTAGVSGILPSTGGGTGQASYTIGDMLYASGTTALSKLADVAVGNKLYSGGVATAPAWGLGFKIITFTRDTSAAGANVAYTGVGFKPTTLIGFAGIAGTAKYSLFGFADASTARAVADSAAVSAGTYDDTGALFYVVNSAGSNYTTAVISTFDADGFTLAWAKTGSPTGTINCYVLAMR